MQDIDITKFRVCYECETYVPSTSSKKKNRNLKCSWCGSKRIKFMKKEGILIKKHGLREEPEHKILLETVEGRMQLFKRRMKYATQPTIVRSEHATGNDQ